MLDINNNISHLKPSATLLINEKIKELRANGEKVVHFGFGQSPFPIHKDIVKKLKNNANCNDYLPTQGLLELREEISNFLFKHQGIKTTCGNIYIGPGSKELLYQTILLINGTYLIPKGSWVSYLPQIKANNKMAIILNTFREDNYKLTSTVLDKYCKKNPSKNKLLILNSPNNPSGAIYSESELECIADVCKKYKIIVLSDEIYTQISFETDYATSISKYYPENTVIFGGLSKVFSAGGYRLGYMVLPQNLQKLNFIYRTLFSETFSAVSSPIQHAAIEAYKYNKDIKINVKAATSILKLIGNYVFDELTKENINCSKPEGGFYVLIDFENFRKEINDLNIKNSTDLANYLLTEYKVALLPGTDFYFNPDEIIFRLAYVDFDGKKALEAVLENKVDLDNSFISNYAPNIIMGVQKLIDFVKSLS
jgi:aspartate aminotransferase